jgi:hypothetical protein
MQMNIKIIKKIFFYDHFIFNFILNIYASIIARKKLFESFLEAIGLLGEYNLFLYVFFESSKQNESISVLRYEKVYNFEKIFQKKLVGICYFFRNQVEIQKILINISIIYIIFIKK